MHTTYYLLFTVGMGSMYNENSPHLQLTEEDLLIYEVVEWCLLILSSEVDEACRLVLLDILRLVHDSKA